MEEISKKPRRPDFVGFIADVTTLKNIKVAVWDNGHYLSLHIGEMKIRLNKNESRLGEDMEEPKITMEDVQNGI